MIPPRRELAAGAGWRALDIVCSAGPADARVEEWYDAVNIALVMDGTFNYRSVQGAATLAPGGIVLGNYGVCFECGHEHTIGDRCLAFHFAPAVFEEVLSSTPGVRSFAFAPASLPPLDVTVRLLAAAETARDEDDAETLEELAFYAASHIAAMAAGADVNTKAARAADARRIAEAIRRIEADLSHRFTLAGLAREAGMSRYHFLRVFREVAGVTPHQFVLGRRMHRAAVRLRKTALPVAEIAFDEGFEDLSTFNRRFRKVMGATPTAWRAQR
ncbi:MAG: AraC family transcriptional regulator [Pseudomonadota bacterium]|nr:AraC family transcriptional regulator [Pseudomonadota bacterium]